MDTGGVSWGLQTIIGAAILAAVLLWVVLRNRHRSRAEHDRTERATDELYKQEEAARDREDDNVP
jgi:hypothetical protein